jgi:hypothetical protein
MEASAGAPVRRDKLAVQAEAARVPNKSGRPTKGLCGL